MTSTTEITRLKHGHVLTPKNFTCPPPEAVPEVLKPLATEVHELRAKISAAVVAHSQIMKQEVYAAAEKADAAAHAAATRAGKPAPKTSAVDKLAADRNTAETLVADLQNALAHTAQEFLDLLLANAEEIEAAAFADLDVAEAAYLGTVDGLAALQQRYAEARKFAGYVRLATTDPGLGGWSPVRPGQPFQVTANGLQVIPATAGDLEAAVRTEVERTRMAFGGAAARAKSTVTGAFLVERVVGGKRAMVPVGADTTGWRIP